MATLGNVTANRVQVTQGPIAADDVVRLSDLQQEVSGVAPAGHTHAWAAVTGTFNGVKGVLFSEGLLLGSDSVAWLASGVAYAASVRLSSGGGLVSTSNGLQADTGTTPGTLAAGDHTHAQLHDPVTVVGTDAIGLGLAGQQITATLLLAGGSSGLEVAAGSGLRVIFGTTPGTVAAGEHTHAQLHNAVTVANTNSLALYLAGQHVTGAVRIDPAPGQNHAKVAIGANGLYVPTGQDSGVAAPGIHAHAVATAAADGFLSAADKIKLDGLPASVSDLLTQAAGDARYALTNGLGPGQTWVGSDSGVATARTWTGVVSLTSTGVTALVNGAVADAALGNRTVDDTLPTPASTGTLTQLLSWMGGRLKAITGEAGWTVGPATDLSAAAAHAANTSNPHGVTASQVGLGNVLNVAQVDKTGDIMTGALQTTALGVGIAPAVPLHVSTASGDIVTRLGHDTTDRLDVGVAGGANGMATGTVLGDAVLKNLTLSGRFFFESDGGVVRPPSKSTPGDPTALNGGIYYNANTNKLRVCEDGTWKDLAAASVGGSSGQVQFNNGGGFGGDSNLLWENTGKVLVVGTGLTPDATVDIHCGNIRVDGSGSNPSTTGGALPTAWYGSPSATAVLAQPNFWLAFKHGATTVSVPAYTA